MTWVVECDGWFLPEPHVFDDQQDAQDFCAAWNCGYPFPEYPLFAPVKRALIQGEDPT